MSGEWELDMEYLQGLEMDGGFLVDHVPMIGEQNLDVRDHLGERFHLPYQVDSIHRVDEAGTTFSLHLVGLPIPMHVHLSDLTKAVPLAEPPNGMIHPKLFRKRTAKPEVVAAVAATNPRARVRKIEPTAPTPDPRQHHAVTDCVQDS